MKTIELNDFAMGCLIRYGTTFVSVNKQFNPAVNDTIIVFQSDRKNGVGKGVEYVTKVSEVLLSAAFGNDENVIGICVLETSDKTVGDCVSKDDNLH